MQNQIKDEQKTYHKGKDKSIVKDETKTINISRKT